MKSIKNIKRMLLGIALLVFAVWCLIFGYVDNFPIAIYLGVLLHWVGIVLAVLGYFDSDKDTKEKE